MNSDDVLALTSSWLLVSYYAQRRVYIGAENVKKCEVVAAGDCLLGWRLNRSNRGAPNRLDGSRAVLGDCCDLQIGLLLVDGGEECSVRRASTEGGMGSTSIGCGLTAHWERQASKSRLLIRGGVSLHGCIAIRS